MSINGLRFDALAVGPTEGPLVLCLHGFPQFADAWLPILESLASQGAHAVAVDQRGYSPGARPAAVEDYRMAHLVADVMGIADHLGAARFHLVGHDWGGAVAWAVAASYPDRLASLNVLSTPHPAALAAALRSDADQQKRSAYFRLFAANDGSTEKLLLANRGAALRDAYQGKLAAEAVTRNIQRLSADGALTAALNWYRAMAQNLPAGHIQVPTLYVWGDRDQALGQAAALATADYCDGPYRFEVLSGKSHWLIEECQQDIERLLQDHLGLAAE